LRFVATPEKGEVSALLVVPKGASHLLVVGHGASTNMLHANLQTIAERMADVGIATFRYNFPYMEHGTGRDSQAVCTATVRSAVAAARATAPKLPLLAGGHSFGGRMTSHAAAESALAGVSGLVFFAFPLHQPGKPDTKRAEHLSAVSVPMLFLSGTRDELANMDLLRPVCRQLGKLATLHALDTADHGFKTLKRSRKSEEDVFVEMARAVREWTSKLRR
jgi:predicted alpha/beta-hydrolase family hydrolase